MIGSRTMVLSTCIACAILLCDRRQSTQGATAEVESLVNLVAPIVVDDDLFVARVNISQGKHERLCDFWEQIVQQSGVVNASSGAPPVATLRSITKFLKPDDAHAVFVLGFLPTLAQRQVSFVVHVDREVYGNALRDALVRELGADWRASGDGTNVVAELGSLLYVGNRREYVVRQRAMSMPPSSRVTRTTELQNAFQLVPDATIQIALLPYDILRGLREIQPPLPAEFPMSATALADSVQACAAGVTCGENTIAMNVVVKTSSSGQAREMQEAISAVLRPFGTRLLPEAKPQITQALASLSVADQKVTWSVDNAEELIQPGGLINLVIEKFQRLRRPSNSM